LFGISQGLLWLVCLVSAGLSGAAVLALGPAIARRQRIIRGSELTDRAVISGSSPM
jgi:hypothetical protein